MGVRRSFPVRTEDSSILHSVPRTVGTSYGTLHLLWHPALLPAHGTGEQPPWRITSPLSELNIRRPVSEQDRRKPLAVAPEPPPRV